MNTTKIIITEYSKNFNSKFLPVLQHAAENYQDDFSLILKQNYVNILGEYVRYEQLLKDPLELLALKTGNETIKKLFKDLESLDFHHLFFEFYNRANTFITEIKNTDSFEQQLAIAGPVIESWTKYVNRINKFNEIVNALAECLECLEES